MFIKFALLLVLCLIAWNVLFNARRVASGWQNLKSIRAAHDAREALIVQFGQLHSEFMRLKRASTLGEDAWKQAEQLRGLAITVMTSTGANEAIALHHILTAVAIARKLAGNGEAIVPLTG